MRPLDGWLDLDRFDDRSVPKLHNLKRAARAGFEVPETRWKLARSLGSPVPPSPFDVPFIVRSGSPSEDTHVTSNAGQLTSVVVRDPLDFADAVARVVASLPGGEGVVFVQPMVEAETAGVTFFDGFYYEETSAAGSNEGLTSGRERGQVRRGHVRRGDARDAWLVRLHRLFGGRIDGVSLPILARSLGQIPGGRGLPYSATPESARTGRATSVPELRSTADPGHPESVIDSNIASGGRIDVEWAFRAGAEVPVLLQVRPALFAVKRSETLSLANHKEILGDPPSPWMVGLLAEVGRPVMGYFERVDPEVATWDEPYAVELAERAWMNFSAFFRLMDHWGLPRSMVTDGVGGEREGPLDDRLDLARFLRMTPTMVRKAWGDNVEMLAIRRGLKRLDAELGKARTLQDLWRVNADALAFSIRVNFAVNSLLAIVAKVRRKLGLGLAGRVVTVEMMARYAELASRPATLDRWAGLDAWLVDYGHRGPLESDPARPRFDELRESLRAGLERGPGRTPGPRPRPNGFARPFFLLDEVREWFRDRLMHWWQRLRARILEEAKVVTSQGFIDEPDDVFMLRGDDLAADPATWRSRVAARRVAWEHARTLDLPSTSSREAIEAAIGSATSGQGEDHQGRFRGIGLGSRVVVGKVVRASELRPLLDGRDLPESPILLAPTLEPSWAVVFPRFAAVVVELGGELSHASILLREAGITAVVNARGAYRSIADGSRVTVDPGRGEVRVE